MTHVGQKLTFRATRNLSRISRPPHLRFRLLSFRHFLLQLGGAFLHSRFQLVVGILQRQIALLNSIQHLVEGMHQFSGFVSALRSRPQRIVVLA